MRRLLKFYSGNTTPWPEAIRKEVLVETNCSKEEIEKKIRYFAKVFRLTESWEIEAHLDIILKALEESSVIRLLPMKFELIAF